MRTNRLSDHGLSIIPLQVPETTDFIRTTPSTVDPPESRGVEFDFPDIVALEEVRPVPLDLCGGWGTQRKQSQSASFPCIFIHAKTVLSSV